MVLFAFLVGSIALVGNIVLSPKQLVQFLLYWLVFSVLLLVLDNKIGLVKVFIWLGDQIHWKLNQSWLGRRLGLIGINKRLARWIRRERRPPVVSIECSAPMKSQTESCNHEKFDSLVAHRSLTFLFTHCKQIYFTKTDELSHLISALLYVKSNEVTSRVILVHCFNSVDQIHSELESNMQLTDESFPTISEQSSNIDDTMSRV